MKLLGKDISAAQLMDAVRDRLQQRGLEAPSDHGLSADELEARVDPLSFNLEALTEHADPTRGLPLETHRAGLGGRAVVLAKWAFRRVGQVFINEALGRQRLFNGHVRDSYAQLSAEVLRLREQLAALQREVAQRPPPPPPAVVVPEAKPQSVRRAPRRKS